MVTYKIHGLSPGTEYIWFDIYVHFSTYLCVFNKKIYMFENEKYNMQ